MKDTLIQKINKSIWWHVTPSDPDAYKKRGKFLASTYSQAEFYGRPNDQPEKVEIKNPVFGFSEKEILEQLFDSMASKLLDTVENAQAEWYEKRIELDAMMHSRAKSLGYDAIVLVCPQGKKALEKGRKPNAIELNLMY